MMRPTKNSVARFGAWTAAALLTCVFAASKQAEAQQVSATINLSASQNPVPGGNYPVLNATVTGVAGLPTPTGSVDFFQTNNGSCVTNSNDLGTVPIYNGVATDYVYNLATGTDDICATYTGDNNYPATTTASPLVLVYYQTTTFTVTAPGEALAGQAITFNFTLTTPTGQPSPTGTVTLYDNNTGDTLGTVTVGSGGTVPSITTSSLSQGSYYAEYNGDNNYTAQYYNGTVFFEMGLVLLKPGAVTLGSPDTTVTLLGNGFTANSVAQIAYDNQVNLTTTYVSPNKLQAVVPSGYLAQTGTLPLQVYTNPVTTNQVQLQIYSPQTDQVTGAAAPATFVYGQAATATFTANVTRGVTTDLGVPGQGGSVAFYLNGPSSSPSNVYIGTATPTQVTTAGSYQAGASPVLDTPSAKFLSADLNGDGYADIVSLPNGNYYDGNVYLQVLLSTGANTFQNEAQIFAGCTAEDFAVADINKDGIPDIVVACSTYNSPTPIATYLLGNGDGTFAAPVSIAATTSITSPTNIAVGDFNGDGALDVALIDGSGGNLQVFTGSATFGTFTAQLAMTFDVTAGSAVNVEAADFNQDGKSDLALLEFANGYSGSSGAGVVLLLTSKGNGSFTSATQGFTASTYSMNSLTITDVNGDGYPDVAVADPGGYNSDNGQILIFENNKSGALNPVYAYAATYPSVVTGAPFPVIGKPATSGAVAPGWSIAYSWIPSDSNSISVTALQRQSATSYTETYTVSNIGYSVNSDEGFTATPIVAGDFNGDGYLDLAVFNINPNDDTTTYQTTPLYYGNDSAASVTGSIQQPVAGTYNLTAGFSGDHLYQAATSPNVQVVVTPAAPSGNVTGPSASTVGQNVTFTATVLGVANGVLPTGAVQFYDNGTALGAAQALVPGDGDAVAQLTTSQLTTGTHSITATYTGDTNYTLLTFGPAQIVVSATSTSLTLTSSTTSTTAGAMVTFDMQLSGTSFPVGETVTLSGIPTTTAAPVLDATGHAVYRFGIFAPGAYTIQAQYYGDANFSPATSNSVTLQIAATPVAVNLTSSANPVAYPTPINLTATVNSGGFGVPAGTIAFDKSSTSLGNGTLATVGGTSGLASSGVFDATGEQEIAVATGDFNKDGKQDLAVLQSDDGTVTLLVSLGNGDGTFQAPVSYGANQGVDASAVALAAADFNGDGYSDLAIASSDGNVTILLATGDSAGDLQVSQTLGVSGAMGVATGDFNKDGHPDLAVITSNSVSVFLGSAAGTFPRAPSYSNAQEARFSGIAVADFNQDGYSDIAVSNSAASNVYVYLYNPSNATFTVQSYAAGTSANGVATGDFNGDKYPDLAVLSQNDSTVAILTNDKTGAFPTAVSYGTVSQPEAVTTADFNGDGFADVAVAGVAGGQGGGTSILFGSVSGAMTGEASLVDDFGFSIASADFNGDGYPDLAIGYNNGVSAFVDSAAQATLTGVVLPAGTSALTAAFTPEAETSFAGVTSNTVNEVVNQGTPVITWSSPAPIAYGTPLSATQLNATATPAGGIFTYTPPVGTVLAPGTQTLSVIYTPTDTTDYKPATASVQLLVNPPALTLTAINPASGQLGAAAMTVALTGNGFDATSVAQLNGAAIPTVLVSATQLQATIPASFFQKVQTGVVTVEETTTGFVSQGLDFSVVSPPVQVVLSGPGTEQPAQQPTLTFQLSQPYPVDLQGTFILTVQPATSGGPVDPAVQFSTGGDTFTFTLPANTTTTPTIQLQTGTLAATITVTLTLQAGGVDVTPTGLQPVVIQVPATAPVISSVVLTRDGDNLTVTVQGFSSTRDMKNATFAFTPASGATLDNPTVTVDLGSAFSAWYAQNASIQYGSSFSYVQTFSLSDSATNIQSVTVTLSNSIGNSTTKSAQ